MNSSTPAGPVRPYLSLAFGILAVSTAAIFIRLAQSSAPSLVIAAYRLTLATILLAPIALVRYLPQLRRLRGREQALALFSGIFLALHFASWITSLEYTSVASSVVLVTTTPLWVALLAPITLKEPLSRRVLAGMILALLGGMLVGVSDACTWGEGGLVCPSFSTMVQGRAFIGNVLALVGAWMAAAYLLIGRRLRSEMALVPYIFVVYAMASVVLVLLVAGWQIAEILQSGGLAMGEAVAALRAVFFDYPPQTYLWFLLLALVPQLIGHSTFNWALRYLSAAYVSITLLGEPIGSTILAYFFLQEAPGAFKVIGAILILVGIFIASQSESKNAPLPSPAQTAVDSTARPSLNQE